MKGDESDPGAVWEQRWHPLREEWVVVAAHRQNRPWTGQIVGPRSTAATAATAATTTATPLPHDPSCYLCPGNRRVNGALNPVYTGTYSFDNDHPCVAPDAPREIATPPAPYRARPAVGHARVLCFSPRHDVTVAELPVPEIARIVEQWRRQSRDLSALAGVKHILGFENKGEIVGVSNPHPHGQIYATDFVWKTIETELGACRRHTQTTGRGLFEDIIGAEQRDGGPRILYEDERVVAFVPYFARYAYEVYVAPRRRAPHIFALDDQESASLAIALKDVMVRFDNLWRISFPYVMVLHQAPGDLSDVSAYHFFVSFHPPLRRLGLLKYLAGPEIGGGNFLSDTSPEAKAAELKAVSSIHFSSEGQPA